MLSGLKDSLYQSGCPHIFFDWMTGEIMHIHTIQLNIEKLLGGCIGMDATEFGAYMSLIVACYQAGGKLPNDDKKLSYIARTSTHKWKKIKPVIEKKFLVNNEFWEQKFIKNDLERCMLLSKKNKANALKRNKTSKPVASQSHSQKAANTSNKEQVTNNNIIIPPIIPQGDWDKWMKYRSEIKKPLKPSMIEGQIKKLTEWHNDGFNISDIINESISNGWQGLFKPKNGAKNGKSKIDYIAEGHAKIMDKYRDRGA